jgi:threonine dehydratase
MIDAEAIGAAERAIFPIAQRFVKQVVLVADEAITSAMSFGASD